MNSLDKESDFIFKIQELDLYLIFYPNELKIFDLYSKDLLLTQEIPTEYDYDFIYHTEIQNLIFILKKGENEVLKVSLRPVDMKNKIKTNASYILNLGIDSYEDFSNIGFFTGLYEFGTFEIEKNTINITKSVELDSISYGLISEIGRKFYICRGKKGMECWNWRLETPKLEWKKETVDISKGLVLNKDEKVIIGTRDGKIALLDEHGNEEKQFRILPDPIRHMLWTDACICLTEKKYVYKFTEDGNLIWKTELPDTGPNHALAYEQEKIWVTTYLGTVYTLDNEQGTILDTITIQKENFSPIALFLHKWIVYTAPEYMICKLLAEKNGKEFSTWFSDRMIRALVPVKNGIVTGDDYGEITLLTRPGIEIEYLKDKRKFGKFDPKTD